MSTSPSGGSPSIERPDYWWYQVRSRLLQTVFTPYLADATRVLDVGSADGPSVEWLRGRGHYTPIDIDIRGLRPGGVCASATALPFRDEAFDVVAAFDVIEHVEHEEDVVGELDRVLSPGGWMLVALPAYQWAWSDHDVANGHYRRYSRRRATAALERAGLHVERTTYMFAGIFPMFAAERLLRRLRQRLSRRQHEVADVVNVPDLPPIVERVLLGLSRFDERWLSRRDLAVGSSVVVAARKPDRTPAAQPPAALTQGR